MRLKYDKTLEKNLKLLKNCSLVKIMELTLRQEKYNQQKSIKGYNKSQQINTTLDELHELNEILSEKRVNLSELHHFLNDNEHSKNFQKFSSFIQDTPAILLSYKFKNRAQKIAEENNLFTGENPSYVTDNLGKAFNIDDITITLNKDFKERCFKGVIGGTVAALGTAAAIYGATSIFNPKEPNTPNTNKPEISGPEQPGEDISTSEVSENTTSDPTTLDTKNEIDSYAEACADFYEKTAQVYKNNTGKDIDLSGYTQENLGRLEGFVMIANYNGKTYRFTSKPHLQKALEAAGATIEMKEDSFLYIYDGDESLAIVDSHNNPVISGNVLEPAPGGYGQMYNQKYVNEGRKILQNKGIDSSGMSEAELVGHYLLSENNPTLELSEALAETSNLANIIKDKFYYNSNKEGTNRYGENLIAIDNYIAASENFEGTHPELIVVTEQSNTEAQQDTSKITPHEHDDR